MFSTKNLSTRISSRQFNFELSEGEILFVRGPSGSGKSILLRALADLDEHQGEVTLDDREQIEWKPCEWRKAVAYCPAESAWWSEVVGDHFEHAPDSDLINKLGFTDAVLDWHTDRLSSGEKQRLGLLRVLAQYPKVILLDEPTANLDEENVLAVERVLDEYRKKNSTIFIWVSHSPAQQARFNSEVLELVD